MFPNPKKSFVIVGLTICVLVSLSIYSNPEYVGNDFFVDEEKFHKQPESNKGNPKANHQKNQET